MSDPFRPLIAVLCFALSIAFAASPLFVENFGGFDPNQFPIPQKNPPVQPAGYAFSIWGVIYGWLILGTGWGMAKALRDGPWHEMRLPLCLSLAMGAGWLAVAVASPVWAAVLIWAMLLSALAALFMAPVSDRVWAAYPVGLYTGWLSAASCVSLGLLAAGYGFMDANTAGIVFVALAAILGTFIQAVLGRAPTYGIAVIWALVAVVIANWGKSSVATLIVGTAGIALVAVPTLMALRRR